MPARNRTALKTRNQALLAERLRCKWTQQEVAERIGTTVVNVSRWERGITSPGPYFRQELCRLFDKSAVELGLFPEIESPSDPEDTSPARPADPLFSLARREMPEQTTQETSPDLRERANVRDPINLGLFRRNSTRWRIRPTARLRISISVLAAILLLMLYPLWLIFQSPGLFHATQSVAKATPPRHEQLPSVLLYSFEDGGIDGWVPHGHIVSMQNSSEVGGYDGNHALKVVFYSDDSDDQPYLSVNPLTDRPVSNQVLHAALFLPRGTTSTVTAKLYVQKADYNWAPTLLSTVLIAGKWNLITYRIPLMPGPGLQVGIQFLSVPFNTLTTVYADAIGWG